MVIVLGCKSWASNHIDQFQNTYTETFRGLALGNNSNRSSYHHSIENVTYFYRL